MDMTQADRQRRGGRQTGGAQTDRAWLGRAQKTAAALGAIEPQGQKPGKEHVGLAGAFGGGFAIARGVDL